MLYTPSGSYQDDWERAVNGSRARDSRRPQPGVAGDPASGAQVTPPAYGAPYAQPQATPQQPPYGAPYPYQQAMPAQPAPAPVMRIRKRTSGCYTFLSWTALLLWAAFIYYMSAHSSSELAQGIFAHIRAYIEQIVWQYYGYIEDPVSPIGHFCEYFILGALLGNALHCHMPLIPATIIAVLVASGYGVTDEIHQIYVDGRYPDVEDWKIDTIAATLGSILASFIFYMFPRKVEYIPA